MLKVNKLFNSTLNKIDKIKNFDIYILKYEKSIVDFKQSNIYLILNKDHTIFISNIPSTEIF